MKVMFALKNNIMFVRQTGTGIGSGLTNNAQMTAGALYDEGVETVVREMKNVKWLAEYVHNEQPDVVVVQALWLEPHDLKWLINKFPGVRVAVHVHSNMPFLSLESDAIQRLIDYAKMGVEIIANCLEAFQAMACFLPKKLIHLCGNIYHRPEIPKKPTSNETLEIGCFGAIRPQKNQLQQALAAIQFSDFQSKQLNFHVNSTRFEAGGNGVFNNIMALFMNSEKHELCPAGWVPEQEFPEYISKMDISLQVSLTETFNLVTADAVMANTPVVVSNQISWVSPSCQVKRNDVVDIISRMNIVIENKSLVEENKQRLKEYKLGALADWRRFLNGKKAKTG